MEYQRIEQSGEIVLSYCPARQAEEVELRYERQLPERMREEEPADVIAEVSPAAAEEQMLPKKKKRRTWVVVTAVVLCFSLAIGCVGAGLWGIAQTLTQLLPEVMTPGDGEENSQSDPDRDNDSGDQDKTPDWYYNEDVIVDNEGEPEIESYRPEGEIPQLKLVSVAPGRRQLSAGEIYAKVSPSTVTVLGDYGVSYSVGTGVIFTSDGYIITNYHVIAGCMDCVVWVTDEYGVDSSYTAKFVGGDAKKDLAVLKIDAQGLPAAEFGVSSELSVGDTVYAIGNPLGTELRSTFTDGIVSAVDRNVEVDGVTMTLIQTNAALNSGNSGGPLINAYGQVVGINTIKMMSSEDTIEGLGFAIPSSLAQRWVNDILTIGEVRPSPVLGLSVNRIPVRLSDGTEGLEVLEVTKGLGAYRAGVQVGDVVVGFNGARVRRVDDIYAERLKLSVGDLVVIRVYRNGEYLDLTMTMMVEPE